MRVVESRRAMRARARAYEEALPSLQRKMLGQFFTGVPLGKLLSHLALDPATRSVLDPMAGHGDLLDAVWEASCERGINLSYLEGIEIDEATTAIGNQRLAGMTDDRCSLNRTMLNGNAFETKTLNSLSRNAYDLVITNPPYVRYQTLNKNDGGTEKIKKSLIAIINNHLTGTDREILTGLAEGYSGLADLSVPAWILAGLLVKSGGHLAIVVPSTWRSRDYADVIRYYILRCFSLEYIVEDTQPGWFSDALVRTHLIVAKRLSSDETSLPLYERGILSSARWIQIAPQAASEESLVGAAFKERYPEFAFTAWLRNSSLTEKHGIKVREFDINHERATLDTKARRRLWYQKLECHTQDLQLFASTSPPETISIPDTLRGVLPSGIDPGSLCALQNIGIQVGQGLRTGCNRFFYVTETGTSDSGMVRVKTSSVLGGREIYVPAGALRPVLRKQSEMPIFQSGDIPPGRVLDLRQWVLPEDANTVADARDSYIASGETPPQVMPEELVTFVRLAATFPLDESDDGKRIPNLSAVRTNVRAQRNGGTPPRFWYMLPNFAPRHVPAAFVARINHGLPWVECNTETPILIDANFSTIWSSDGSWTGYALKALLNSVWCRIYMEALGTLLGGGALKLEASHLRQIPIPRISLATRNELNMLGRKLSKNISNILTQIDEIVLYDLFPIRKRGQVTGAVITGMETRLDKMRLARQRPAL